MMIIDTNIVSSRRVLLLLICSHFITHSTGEAISNTESELIRNITHNYCKEARPVLDNKSPVLVSFGLEFIQLIKVCL